MAKILILFLILLLLTLYFNYNNRKCLIVEKTNDVIPKKIHQIWIGNEPLPIHKKLYTKSFKKIHPSWQYKLWNNNDITEDNFPLTFSYITKVLNSDVKGKFAKAADLMRYEILFHQGGFYFDTNIELLQDIEKYIPNFENYAFILCHELPKFDKKWISNGFFACPKNNKYIQNILSKNVLDKIDFTDMACNCTGPKLFATCFSDINFCNIKLLHSEAIYPVHWKTPENDLCVTPVSYDTNEKNINIVFFKNKSQQLEYPCKKFENSLAIDHFIFGASWW